MQSSTRLPSPAKTFSTRLLNPQNKLINSLSSRFYLPHNLNLAALCSSLDTCLCQSKYFLSSCISSNGRISYQNAFPFYLVVPVFHCSDFSVRNIGVFWTFRAFLHFVSSWVRFTVRFLIGSVPVIPVPGSRFGFADILFLIRKSQCVKFTA